MSLSKSAISYQLSKLREIFNDELFIRTSNGLKPTAYCLSISPKVNDLLSRIQEDLFQGGEIIPNSITRDIKINADITAANWFPQLLFEAKTDLPRLRLSLRTWNSHSYQDIADGIIDFGIQHVPNISCSVFESDLCLSHRVFVVRSQHPLVQKGSISLYDLTQYPVVIPDLGGWNDNGNSLMEKVLKKSNMQLNLLGRIGDLSALYKSVSLFNCISYVTTISLPDDLNGLTVLPAPKELNDEKVYYKLFISRQQYGSQQFDFITNFITKSFIAFNKTKHETLNLPFL